MIRVLTPKEELASRRANFDRLASGALFDLGGKRYFIAIEKWDDAVRVIELDSANVARIVQGAPCEPSTLHFNEMACLNVRRANEECDESESTQSSSPTG